MATLDRKCINTKSFAATSELFQTDCRRLKVSTALYVYEGQGGFILFHRLFCKGRGMYTFYSSNILYIMFILCDEYARRYTTHWAKSETLLMWSAVDAWWLWCPVRNRWGRRQKHTTLLLGLRGSAHLSYIPDLQGHWDTVFKYKDNFLKAFQFCALKPFCKDDL